MTHGRAEVHRLLEDHGLRPSRALGQNFVADANTVRRVVRLAGVGPEDRVVEVGAGLGSLTLALLEAGASVTAVEVDRHLLPVLRGEVEPHGAHVVGADALTADWDELADPAAGIWSVVSNLPYNVAVPVVIRVLESAPQVATLLVMVQREVGERLAAGPRSRAYGAVSVKVAYWAEAQLVGAVSPQVFVPRPRVESVLVRVERRPRPGCPHAEHHAEHTEDGLSAVPGPGSADYERLFATVRAGFGQRRKMLRRSLLGMVDPTAFEAAGVAPTARAEQLGLDEWCRLAALVGPAVQQRPASPVKSAPIELRAQAKLTTSLRVVGVRPDGFHLLDAEMVTLDLADSLEVTDAVDVRVSVERADGLDDAGTVGIPVGPENLVVRALEAVGRHAHVRLRKRIPAGAGLGGGSADAAAILRWAGCADVTAAAELGADVPFCLVGGRAAVGGIGELVRPLPYEERDVVLLLAPFGVETAAVYRVFDAMSPRPPTASTDWPPGPDGPSGPAGGNDLEAAALVVEPRLGPWRDAFEQRTGRPARLAGSGSTWFTEGSLESLGIEDPILRVGGAIGRMLTARTTPADR